MREKYLLSAILIFVSIILAIMNEKVDEKIHQWGQYSFKQSGNGRHKRDKEEELEEDEFEIDDHDERFPDQLVQ